MFRLFNVNWSRARCFGLIAWSSLASTTTVWSLGQHRSAEVLYEKSDTSLLSDGGRTAVCFVDGRSEAQVALREAIRSKKAEDKLIVIHFVDSEAPPFDFPAAIVHNPEELQATKEKVYDEAKQMTLQYKSVLETNQVNNVELVLMPCVRPQARAVQFVGDVGAEVVYLGTHNLGPIARTFLGSFSHYILHHTQGCVVIAREKPRGEYKPERLPDEVSKALQSLVVRNDSGIKKDFVQISGKGSGLIGGKQRLDRDLADDTDGDDVIDGFILVGPPSLM